MPNYHRVHQPGGCYFFTVNCAERASNRLLVEHIDLLREAFRYVRTAWPFDIEAMVVLPDHLHCLMTLPEGDADYAVRLRLIKSHFSRHVPKGEALNASRAKRGERGVWQRRYWEHLIRDPDDWQRCVDYIHWNPVKHGLVYRVGDWPYSSFHRFVRDGRLPKDWGLVSNR